MSTPIKVGVPVRIYFFHPMQFSVNLLGFSPLGRFAKNVKGWEICDVMEKINYRKQELDLADRLMDFFEARRIGRVTEPATSGQLRLLGRLGIRPLWIVTRKEAEEMIVHYKTILDSARGSL